MREKEEIRAYYNEAYAEGAYAGTIPLADKHGYGTGLTGQMQKFRPFTKEDVILEIGCGEGLLMEGMCEFVKEVHGVDISDVAISNAKEFLAEEDNCFLYIADNIEFFPDNHFDFIWEQTVFQHMLKNHVREYIDQAYRKLKPDRYVMFQFVFIPNLPNAEHDKPSEQNISSWTLEEFSAEMENVGLDIVGSRKVMVETTEAYYMVGGKK